MAINVYLTLFKKYSAQQLKALEWRYHIMCYGVTFFIALVYLFIDTPERGHMYGPATASSSKVHTYEASILTRIVAVVLD
jgi:hypothetical protein